MGEWPRDAEVADLGCDEYLLLLYLLTVVSSLLLLLAYLPCGE